VAHHRLFAVIEHGDEAVDDDDRLVHHRLPLGWLNVPKT
jgi:hypothetical protein